MTKPFFSDDLSDFLGGDAAPAVHPNPAYGPAGQPFPNDPALARIRAMADQAPAAKAFQVECRKCGGTGRFTSPFGRYIGPCFACKGAGKFERKTAPAVLARAKERRQEQAAAIRQEAAPQIAWIEKTLARGDKLPATFADILRNCLKELQAGRILSEGRQGVIDRGMARDAAYATQHQAKAAERAQAAPVVDASKIVEAFQRAREAGLEDIKLRFQGFTIKPAQAFEGLLVKAGRVNVGKIEAGRFIAFRACTPEQAAQVLAICANPAAAAQAYGFATRSCCVCGRKLTNEESVDTGIGPICSGRMGWTPGRKKVEAPSF